MKVVPGVEKLVRRVVSLEPRAKLHVMQRTALAYIVLRCAELSASRRFYEAVGLTFVEEQHGKGPRHLSCDLDGVVLELYPAGKRAPEALRFGLYTADLEAALDALKELGVETIGKSSTVVRDVDGNTVELLSRPKEERR